MFAVDNEKRLFDILKGILTRVIPISKGGTGATTASEALENLGFGNKVLWSGGYYMTDAHTANFSERISEQKTCIVLVWSDYANGAVNDAGFNFTFIPKCFVEYFEGTGVACFMQSWHGGPVANKYIYVFDDKIK